jgi:hypothetical protein
VASPSEPLYKKLLSQRSSERKKPRKKTKDPTEDGDRVALKHWFNDEEIAYRTYSSNLCSERNSQHIKQLKSQNLQVKQRVIIPTDAMDELLRRAKIMREKEVQIQNSMKVKKVKASERLAAFKNKQPVGA